MHTFRTLLLLLFALFGVSCAHRGVTEIAIDQSTPQAGMRAYIDAVESGNAANLRQCFYVLPKHAKARDDMADFYATSAYFQHVMAAHFPGKSAGIDLATAAKTDLGDVRTHLMDANVTIHGDKAVISGVPLKDGEDIRLVNADWHLRNDNGRWKVDMESPQGEDQATLLDAYVQGTSLTGSEELAYMRIFHEITPGLRKIARSVETGKITTIEEVQWQSSTLVSAAFTKVEAELRAMRAGTK